MELAVLVVASCAIVFSVAAFGFSLFAFIEVQATKRATHTIMPIQQNDFSDFEKKIEQIAKSAGADQGDLNRGLFEAGLDVEDLV